MVKNFLFYLGLLLVPVTVFPQSSQFTAIENNIIDNINKNKWDDVVLLSADLIIENPDMPEGYYYTAMAFYKMDDLENARNYLKKAEEKDGNHKLANKLTDLKADIEQGKQIQGSSASGDKNSPDYWLKLWNLDKSNIEYALNAVEIYIKKKQYVEAVNVLTKDEFFKEPKAREILTWLNNTAEVKAFVDAEAWKKASFNGSINDFQIYLAQHPDGAYVKNAKDKIDDISWNEAQYMNSVESYKKYAMDFPAGNHIKSANSRIKEIQDEASYQKYKDQGDGAFNRQNWEEAISAYNRALQYKSYDSYVKNKKDIAANNLEKERTIAQLNADIKDHERLVKYYNKAARSNFIWTGVFVGGAYAGSRFLTGEDNTDARIAVVGGCSILTVVSLTFWIINLTNAADERGKARNSRYKLKNLSFVPSINPVQKYYGGSLILTLK